MVRMQAPLVHCITNYVTANDCANLLLACGASPIMADEEREVCEITSSCDSLVINLGTLNERRLAAMLAAGRRANELDHPVILDPVGAGASTFRRQAAETLLEQIRFSIIKGNPSEIKSLLAQDLSQREKGVDAVPDDAVTKEKMGTLLRLGGELERMTGAAVVMTGGIDLVVSGGTACTVGNGHPMMAKITGSGCMVAALMGACAAAARKLFLPRRAEGEEASFPEQPGCPSLFDASDEMEWEAKAAAAALAAAGICGERAAARVKGLGLGTGFFHVCFIDEVSKIRGEDLVAEKKVDFPSRQALRSCSGGSGERAPEREALPILLDNQCPL